MSSHVVRTVALALLACAIGCQRAPSRIASSSPSPSPSLSLSPPTTNATNSMTPAAASVPPPLSLDGARRLVDVTDEMEKWVGKKIDVVIVEPLRGPETPEQLAQTTYGQIRVDLRDSRPMDLALVHPS